MSSSMMKSWVGGLKGENSLYLYIIPVGLAHGLLLSLAFLLGYLGRYFFPEQRLEVIQSSVRVDVVALPQFTKQELRQMERGAQSAPIKSVPTVEERPQNSFLSQIAQLAQKKVQVKKRPAGQDQKVQERDHGGTRRQRRELGKLIMAGNKLSQGASLTGRESSERLSQLQLYMESLPRFVRPHWVLPSYLRDRQLQCRIRIFIGRGGKLLEARIIESSGDKQYDHRALEAIRRAPLPAPDESLLKELVRGVVVLGFPL